LDKKQNLSEQSTAQRDFLLTLDGVRGAACLVFLFVTNQSNNAHLGFITIHHAKRRPFAGRRLDSY
jgi:hypothetical protein